MIDQTLGRVLDLFDLEIPQIKRWGEQIRQKPSTAER
jgi:3-polyprenyl-4-hydroxybenzoate decarboxylase